VITIAGTRRWAFLIIINYMKLISKQNAENSFKRKYVGFLLDLGVMDLRVRKKECQVLRNENSSI
jgi:hypothetical protein